MVNLMENNNEEIFSPLQMNLINLLKRNGSMTRAEIVQKMRYNDGRNVPRTTCYDNLMGLMSINIVYKYSRPTNARGRPLVYFRLNEGV